MKSCFADGEGGSADAAVGMEYDEEMVCAICFGLMFEPLRVPCGHGFCATCLERALRTSKVCPLCRRRTAVTELEPWLEMENRIRTEVLDAYSQRRLESGGFVANRKRSKRIRSCLSSVQKIDKMLVLNSFAEMGPALIGTRHSAA